MSGMGLPDAASLPPDAERALPAALELALRLARRQRLARREDALAQVPQALLADAAGDADLAAAGEDVEHQPGRSVAPPAVVLALRDAVVLQVAREQRAVVFELTQDVPAEAARSPSGSRVSIRASSVSPRRRCAIRARMSGMSSAG